MQVRSRTIGVSGYMVSLRRFLLAVALLTATLWAPTAAFASDGVSMANSKSPLLAR